VKDIDTLEAQFKAQLLSALRRAANGRNPNVFLLDDEHARSAARRLQAKAQRILELRQEYSVDDSVVSPAASYLAACTEWERDAGPRSVEQAAKRLLYELES
jgi:hypothetical protein